MRDLYEFLFCPIHGIVWPLLPYIRQFGAVALATIQRFRAKINFN